MQLSQEIDGSKESLHYINEELDPNLRKGLPFQKSFEKVDVTTLRLTSFELNSSLGETFAVPLGFLVYFVVCK